MTARVTQSLRWRRNTARLYRVAPSARRIEPASLAAQLDQALFEIVARRPEAIAPLRVRGARGIGQRPVQVLDLPGPDRADLLGAERDDDVDRLRIDGV